MASVQYTTGAAGSSVPATFMVGLHTVMLAAGWTVEFIDADAIGTGTSGAPAWDKAYPVNVSIGVAVYRMPANGSLARWFVRLEPMWGLGVLRQRINVHVGSAHDGSGNVSNPASAIPEIETTAPSSNQTDGPWWASASEDHLFLYCPGNTTISNFNGAGAFVERVRDASGTVQEPVVAFAKGNGAHLFQLADITAGVVHGLPWFCLASLHSTLTAANPSGSFANAFLGQEPLLGWFVQQGTPFFQNTRAWCLGGDADGLASGDTVNIDVDGGPKAYVAKGSSTAPGWWLVATE